MPTVGYICFHPSDMTRHTRAEIRSSRMLSE